MESEQMYNNYMTVNQYNLFQSQLQWYNELCLSQQNNYNQLCQLQLNERKYCNTCKVFKSYNEFYINKVTKDGLQYRCKQCRFNYSQRPEVQHQIKEYMKKYYVEHNDEINARYKNNINYRLSLILRARIEQLLGNTTICNIMQLVGCDINFFKQWIEFQFTKHMNWDSNIHLDHVQPCASFNLLDPEEQQICFNWRNIQPLFAYANRSKGNKIDYDLIESHKQKATYFLNLYNSQSIN